MALTAQYIKSELVQTNRSISLFIIEEVEEEINGTKFSKFRKWDVEDNLVLSVIRKPFLITSGKKEDREIYRLK